MAKKAAKEHFESIVKDARESFDLGDFLRGRSIRTKSVRVFTDEVTAERRGGFEQTTVKNANGITVPHVRSWGLVKELADAQLALEELNADSTATAKDKKAAQAKIDGLTDEVKALTAKLVETSLVIELKAIPDLIKKDAWRAAKRELGLNGKVSDERMVDLLDENTAQTLVRTVVSITKEETGERNEGISAEGARSLRGLLPDSEWVKIDDALNELLFEKVIADQVVADADF